LKQPTNRRLKLSTVAQLLDASPHHLREIISQHYGETERKRRHPDHVVARYPTRGWFKQGPFWYIREHDLNQQL
jgi:hypothetical protein